jgi:hypothetical protein
MGRLGIRSRHRRKAARLVCAPQSALAIFFGILALAIQCFAVQTHSHASEHVSGPYVAGAGPAAGFAIGGSSAHPGESSDGRFDPAGNSAACLLCWEVVHGGHFVSPVAISVAAPMRGSLEVTFPASVSARAAASRNWRVRGPPAV